MYYPCAYCTARPGPLRTPSKISKARLPVSMVQIRNAASQMHVALRRTFIYECLRLYLLFVQSDFQVGCKHGNGRSTLRAKREWPLQRDGFESGAQPPSQANICHVQNSKRERLWTPPQIQSRYRLAAPPLVTV